MRTVEFCGYSFNPLSIPEIVDLCDEAWSERGTLTLVYQNLHTLHLRTTDHELSDSYDGTTAIIDGLPIVFMLRMAGHDVERSHRVTGLDLLHPVLDSARTSQRRVFVIGQPDPVLQRALDEVRRVHSGLEVDGHHGFFDVEQDTRPVIDAANAFGADLVIVGLGSPKSETWIHANRHAFDASVVWSAGALMEYLAGEVPTPPRWLGPIGLEWAFRMASDPRRFLGRYLLEPPLLLWNLFWRSRK